MASFRVFPKGEGRLELQVRFTGVRGNQCQLSTGIHSEEGFKVAVRDLQARRWKQIRLGLPEQESP